MDSLTNKVNELLEAAKKGNKEKVSQLLNTGVDVNSRLGYFEEPLIFEAAKKCDLDIVQLLVFHGANLFQMDSLGRRAIEIAREYKRTETATYLESKMRDISDEIIKKANRGDCLSNQEREVLTEEMFLYAIQGNLHELKKMVAIGGDIFGVQRRAVHEGYYGGHSLLHSASFGGHLRIVKFLIEEHDFQIFIEDRVKWTPLLYAAQSGHVDIVKYLREKGADVNKTDKFGRTSLYYAIRYHRTDAATYLIREGADVNISDSSGDTPLRVAMHNGDVSICKLLIEYGARANAYTLDFQSRDLGVTTMFRGELEVDREMIKLLEDSGIIPSSSKGVDLDKQFYIQDLRDELIRKVLYNKLCEIKGMITLPSSCFISYAWDSDKHKKWVEQLALDLKIAGINVYLDVWDNPPGTRILNYIKKISTSDFVLLIGSPGLNAKYIQYKENKGNPVIASELDRVDARLMKNSERPDSVIPILRSGTVENAFHPTIQDYTLVYQDFTKDKNYINELLKLVKKLGNFSSKEDALEGVTQDLQIQIDAIKNLTDEKISEYGERIAKIRNESLKETEKAILQLLQS